jgi:hypothetical protein
VSVDTSDLVVRYTPPDPANEYGIVLTTTSQIQA